MCQTQPGGFSPLETPHCVKYLKLASVRRLIPSSTQRDSRSVDGRHWLAEPGFCRSGCCPPRVLTFDKDQIFWDCSKVEYACEAFPSGAPPYPKNKHTPLGELPGPFSLPTIIRNDVEGYQLWGSVVLDYSQSNLTYLSKDKLVALSDIAEQMGQILGDSYAGFFTRTLPWSLMWCISRNDQISGRLRLAEPKRAPSWSWAKADGPVYFSMRRKEDLAKRYPPGDFPMLKDVDVTLGQVRSAALTLWGPTAFAKPKSAPVDESGMWDPDADPDVL